MSVCVCVSYRDYAIGGRALEILYVTFFFFPLNLYKVGLFVRVFRVLARLDHPESPHVGNLNYLKYFPRELRTNESEERKFFVGAKKNFFFQNKRY